MEPLPRKYSERHCPARNRRTSRCGRHSSPKSLDSYEDCRSAPVDPLGTNDMGRMGCPQDSRARNPTAQEYRVGPGPYPAPITPATPPQTSTVVDRPTISRFMTVPFVAVGPWWPATQTLRRMPWRILGSRRSYGQRCADPNSPARRAQRRATPLQLPAGRKPRAVRHTVGCRRPVTSPRPGKRSSTTRDPLGFPKANRS